MRKFDAKAKCLSRPVILEAKRRGSIRFFLTFLLSIALVACGGDSGTSVNDDNVSSSSVIQSGDSHEGSSNSKQSSSSKKGDAGKTSSSSAKTSSSSSSSSQKIASSSSTPRDDIFIFNQRTVPLIDSCDKGTVLLSHIFFINYIQVIN